MSSRGIEGYYDLRSGKLVSPETNKNLSGLSGDELDSFDIALSALEDVFMDPNEVDSKKMSLGQRVLRRVNQEDTNLFKESPPANVATRQFKESVAPVEVPTEPYFAKATEKTLRETDNQLVGSLKAIPDIAATGGDPEEVLLYEYQVPIDEEFWFFPPSVDTLDYRTTRPLWFKFMGDAVAPAVPEYITGKITVELEYDRNKIFIAEYDMEEFGEGATSYTNLANIDNRVYHKIPKPVKCRSHSKIRILANTKDEIKGSNSKFFFPVLSVKKSQM